MGCCGKNRAALNPSPTPTNLPMAQAPLHVRPQATGAQIPGTTRPVGGSVSVRYLEASNAVVRGPVTGRRYAFSGTNPVQSVDARDASAFLHTRFFRRA
jgi:hypothetical protein